MRINQYIAKTTGISRRAADKLIAEQRIKLNNRLAIMGQEVKASDTVTLDDHILTLNTDTTTIMLNKPSGYVSSRQGQGSQTIYDLLPKRFSSLKPVGRLDKDSSGLILLTNDGQLAHRLTHPLFQKLKVYEVQLDKHLTPKDKAAIELGIKLEDGLSKLQIQTKDLKLWTIKMSEGRNRQIRRTFGELGYKVIKLRRIQVGEYNLNGLQSGKHKVLSRLK